MQPYSQAPPQGRGKQAIKTSPKTSGIHRNQVVEVMLSKAQFTGTQHSLSTYFLEPMAAHHIIQMINCTSTSHRELVECSTSWESGLRMVQVHPEDDLNLAARKL